MTSIATIAPKLTERTKSRSNQDNSPNISAIASLLKSLICMRDDQKVYLGAAHVLQQIVAERRALDARLRLGAMTQEAYDTDARSLDVLELRTMAHLKRRAHRAYAETR